MTGIKNEMDILYEQLPLKFDKVLMWWDSLNYYNVYVVTRLDTLHEYLLIKEGAATVNFFQVFLALEEKFHTTPGWVCKTTLDLDEVQAMLK